jgi:hypothetical protein
MNSGDELAATPTELTFTADNFDTAQTVKITAVDDEEIEGDHAGRLEMTLTAADDPVFATKTIAGLDAAITDNDSDPDVSDEDEEATQDDTPTTGPQPPVAPTTATEDQNSDRGDNTGNLDEDTSEPKTSALPSGDGGKKDKKDQDAAVDKNIKNSKLGEGDDKTPQKAAKSIFDKMSEAFEDNPLKLLAALAPLALLMAAIGLLARDPTRGISSGAAGASGGAAGKAAGGKRRKEKDVGKRRSGKIPKGGAAKRSRRGRGGKGGKPDNGDK